MAITYFNKGSDPQQQMPPTLTAVLKQAIKAQSQQLFCNLPCTVVTYDFQTQNATVQPTFANQYEALDENGNPIVQTLPLIYNCPVRWDSSSISYDVHPLNPGDRGVVHFSDRALDTWLASGAIAPPPSSRTHNYTDGWFEPGLRPFNQPIPVSNGIDLLRTINSLQLRMKANGHIQLFTGLNTSASLEFFSLLINCLTQLALQNQSGAVGVIQQLMNFIES